jgi:hypothetical protein
MVPPAPVPAPYASPAPVGYPPMGGYGAPPPIGGYGAPPGPVPYGFPPPIDPSNTNPNIQYMDSLVKQTEEENKKLQDELDKIRADDGDFEGITK